MPFMDVTAIVFAVFMPNMIIKGFKGPIFATKNAEY